MKLKDSFERALALVHEATLEDTRWSEASRLISEISRTRGSALVFTEGTRREGPRFFFTQLHLDGQRRDDLRDEYFRDCYEQDERVPRIRRLHHGRLVHTGDLYTDREKATSRTYNEMLRRTKAQGGLNLRLAGPQESFILWLFLDPSGQGEWDTDQIAIIKRLYPHVRQFLLARQVLVEAREVSASLTGLLDSRRLGVIQLDRQGRIVAANDRALDELRSGDRLIDRAGSLGARVQAESAELSRLLRRALPPFGAQGLAGSTAIGRFSAKGPLALYVCPVGDELPSFEALRPAALVLIADPASRVRVDPDMVADMLRLTPAEGQLAASLATGQTLLDIAESTGRTEKTLRWHLKQIFRKQNISRQVDLVKRVLSLEGFPDSRR